MEISWACVERKAVSSAAADPPPTPLRSDCCASPPRNVRAATETHVASEEMSTNA